MFRFIKRGYQFSSAAETEQRGVAYPLAIPPFYHFNFASTGGHISVASVIAPRPAFQAPRFRVQANDKSIVFHHFSGGILSALRGF